MGFLTGKIVGKVEENGVCRTYLDKDYCGKDNESITV